MFRVALKLRVPYRLSPESDAAKNFPTPISSVYMACPDQMRYFLHMPGDSNLTYAFDQNSGHAQLLQQNLWSREY